MADDVEPNSDSDLEQGSSDINDSNNADTVTTATTDPETEIVPTTQGVTTSITSTTITPGEEENERKWLLPLIIGLGCLVVVSILLFIIYRKWKCFGLPLPFIRNKFQLAKPIKKLADSVRSSISSSSRGSRGADKQFRKYALKTDNSNIVASYEYFTGDKQFSGEFEALKRIDPKDVPVTVAFKPENIMRNRFSNVLPYDKTRVVLTDEGPSVNDYVNANYISGYQKEKEFICTQGPLKQTVGDFWRMCWETKAVAIVMLTKCYEKDQEKCYPYWPSGNTGSSAFGNIKVILEGQTAWKLSNGEDDGTDHLWLVSELRLEKEGEVGANASSAQSHTIIHVVLLSWPDFGVVDPPSSLVSFVRHVQKLSRIQSRNTEEDHDQDSKVKKGEGPIVVHCSAGVGRSGVYIAVDQLLQQLESERQKKSVNIFQTVARMRMERMGMVQNLQQYTLIYKCLQVLINKDKKLGQHDEVEPVRINVDEIQGSDWGLISTQA